MDYSEILKELCEIIVARSEQEDAVDRQQTLLEIEKLAKKILEKCY